ncbi:MAG: CaiB/BaiF CoA-transferase family protein [Pseudomonadota bacterium]|nr:CaiB/BaiF CoA-transferase family protein [Pseudomonadota bacterium]
MAGPLSGFKVIELAGQGPAPFVGSILADFGADVVLIDRPPGTQWRPDVSRKYDFYMRNKRSVALDLKTADGLETAKRLIAEADVLIEGFRPGVVERIGLGPDVCLEINPKLVFGRMTGWGQDGPLALEAGHDINYLALTGALNSIGEADRPPPPPLNLVADLGGGGMFLVTGILMALHAVRDGAPGQVVDCAILDGVSQLMSMFQGFRQQGLWSGNRADNIVDGAAPYFANYETKDGKYVSVGAMEPVFYTKLVEGMGLVEADLPDRDERANWAEIKSIFQEVFLTRTRDEWAEHMVGRDACFSPVLSIDEAWTHPQMVARQTFSEFDGLRYPSPAPRLSGTPGTLRKAPPEPGEDTESVLADWGIEQAAAE